MAEAMDPCRRFLDYYEITDLGKGDVKKCIEKSSKTEFVVKKNNLLSMFGPYSEYLESEIKICRKLNHPNIVQLHDSIKEENHHYLVFELIHNGAKLLTDVSIREFYSESDAALCMKQILEAVDYCHKKNIVHRNVNLETVLVGKSTKGAIAKLHDFRIAIEVQDDKKEYHTFAGPNGYFSPEVLDKKPYGKPVDVWGCGVILYTLLNGYLPFWDDDRRQLFEKIKECNVQYYSPEWNKIDQKAKDLINQMLNANQDERITAANALQHPWILGIERVATPPLRTDETVVRRTRFNAYKMMKNAIITVIATKRASKSEKKTDDTSEAEKVKEIVDKTQKLVTAFSNGDEDAVEELCNNFMTAFSPESLGHIITGTEFHLKNPTASSTTITNPHVHFIGESASISYGRMGQYIDNQGNPKKAPLSETRVWHKADGRWRNVHFHSSFSSDTITDQ